MTEWTPSGGVERPEETGLRPDTGEPRSAAEFRPETGERRTGAEVRPEAGEPGGAGAFPSGTGEPRSGAEFRPGTGERRPGVESGPEAEGSGVAGAYSPGAGESGSAAESGPETGESRPAAASPSREARLLPRDECDQFELRLQHAVGRFVDRPKEAVEEADQVVQEVASRLAEAVSSRRRTLKASWQETGDASHPSADTEQLRLALRDYRATAERLLSM